MLDPQFHLTALLFNVEFLNAETTSLLLEDAAPSVLMVFCVHNKLMYNGIKHEAKKFALGDLATIISLENYRVNTFGKK